MTGENATPGVVEDVSAHVLPVQARGRHDAYDIYAEIYALRMDDGVPAPRPAV